MSYLWSPDLLPYLPSPLLRSLHRDVCRLRGSRYGTKSPLSPYLKYSTWSQLIGYHAQVLREFRSRGYKTAKGWHDPYYRGRSVPAWTPEEVHIPILHDSFPEHTPDYYQKSLHRALKRLQRGSWLPEDTYRLQTAPRAI